MKNPVLDIRIGTLVSGNANTASYIRQIKPHGFESLTINFWREIGAINLKDLAQQVREAIGTDDIPISALGIFGNPLETETTDLATVKAWESLIDHAPLFGASMVVGFAGRLRGKKVDESMKRYAEVFGPLAKRAADNGVRSPSKIATWAATGTLAIGTSPTLPQPGR
jgi:sugar phosphate isomerase/epimerase